MQFRHKLVTILLIWLVLTPIFSNFVILPASASPTKPVFVQRGGGARTDFADEGITPSVYFDQANYIFTTKYGTYTWLQPSYILKYANTTGQTIIDKSMYILQENSSGTWLPLLNYENVAITTVNSTYYSVGWNNVEKYRGKDYIIGHTTIQFNIPDNSPPKTSVLFNKNLSNWTTLGLGSFRWIWDVVPYVNTTSNTGFKYFVNSTESDNSTFELPTASLTNLTNKTSFYISDKPAYNVADNWCNLNNNEAILTQGGNDPYWNSRGIVSIYPVNQSFIDPTVSWTTVFDSFTPAGTGWQNYDIYTNKGVPKGAVALIVCANGNDATDVDMGVRADGSSLSRKIYIHEAEGGGVSTVQMFVTVDASTGYIETYCSTTTGVTFYLLGYWTDVTFTELFETTSATNNDNAWHSVTATSVPASAVIQVAANNLEGGANRDLGVRAVGSSLTRYFLVDEAEVASSSRFNSYSVCVKVDSNSQYQYFAPTISAATPMYAVLGYFDSSLDYVEKWTLASDPSGGDGVWSDWNVYATLSEFSQPTTTISDILGSTSNSRLGGRITYTGTINSVGLKISRSNSPSGTVSCTIRNSATDAIIATSTTTVDCSEIPTASGGKWFYFAFDDLTFSGDDIRISVEYSGGDATNYLRVWSYSDVSAVVLTKYTGAWTDYSSSDIALAISSVDLSAIISCDFVLAHEDSGAETGIGVRPNGDTTSAIILEHEAEGGGANGEEWITFSSDGIVEIYCDDASESIFYFAGYFLAVDTGGSGINNVFTLLETLAVLTSTQKTRTQQNNILESISVILGLIPATGYFEFLTEQIETTSSQQKQMSITQINSEVAQPTDENLATKSISTILSEVVDSSSLFSYVRGFCKTILEVFGITQESTDSKTLLAQVSESILLNTQILTQKTLSQILTEVSGTTSSATGNKGLYINLFEALTTTSSSTSQKALNNIIEEILSTVASTTTKKEIYNILQDAIQLSTLLQFNRGTSSILFESIATTVSATSTKTLSMIVQETLQALESMQSTKAITNILQGIIDITDSTIRSRGLSVILLETISNAISSSSSKTLSAILQETLQALESTQSNKSIQAILQELIEITLSVERNRGLSVVLLETISNIVSTSSSKTLSSILQETLQTLSTMNPNKAIQTVLQGIVEITQSTERNRGLGVVIIETINALTSPYSSKTLSTLVQEFVQTIATAQSAKTIQTLLQDITVITQGTLSGKTINSVISELLNINELTEVTKVIHAIINEFALDEIVTISSNLITNKSIFNTIVESITVNSIVRFFVHILQTIMNIIFPSSSVTGDGTIASPTPTPIPTVTPTPTPTPSGGGGGGVIYPYPDYAKISLDIVIISTSINYEAFTEESYFVFEVTNKGTKAADVTFNWTLTGHNSSFTTGGTGTLFISGYDKKNITVTIPKIPDGMYTLMVVGLDTGATGTRNLTVTTLKLSENTLLIIVILLVLVFIIALLLLNYKKESKKFEQMIFQRN